VLPCERINMPPLPPAERERALNGLLDDLVTVFAHVLSEPTLYPATTSVQELGQSVIRREFPDLHLLNCIVGFVLNQMKWTARSRHLTAEEHHINDAAWRISDALHGPRAN
jgi:hypothetical protein